MPLGPPLFIQEANLFSEDRRDKKKETFMKKLLTKQPKALNSWYYIFHLPENLDPAPAMPKYRWERWLTHTFSLLLWKSVFLKFYCWDVLAGIPMTSIFILCLCGQQAWYLSLSLVQRVQSFLSRFVFQSLIVTNNVLFLWFTKNDGIYQTEAYRSNQSNCFYESHFMHPNATQCAVH